MKYVRYYLYYRKIFIKNENEEFDGNNQKLRKIIISLIFFYLLFNSICVYFLKDNYNVNEDSFN